MAIKSMVVMVGHGVYVVTNLACDYDKNVRNVINNVASKSSLTGMCFEFSY